MRLVSLFGALSAFSSLAVYALPAAEPLEAALVKRDTCELEKRGYGGYPDPGPAGTLLEPQGGFQTVVNGGSIPVTFQTLNLYNLKTRSISVFLYNQRLGYNETLATNLTPLYKNNEVEPNIEVSFRVPKTIPGFGSDYQLEVWEAQIDPGDMSSRIVEFFRIAAPYITITFAG